jgi:hypothetical protein
MQPRSDTLTAETFVTYASWSDSRLLLAALQELPLSAQAEVDDFLTRRNISPIAELTVAETEVEFDDIWTTLLNRLTLWRDDLMARLYDELCVQRDYCANRSSQDFAFWSDLIIVIAGILGDLGFLALSLLLVRRLLDQLCGCG